MKNKLPFLIIVFLSLSIVQNVYSTSQFTKFLDNPVLSPNAIGWNSRGVTSPFILRTANEYRMYYAGNDGFRTYIGLALSSDGINWTNYVNNPIFPQTESENNAEAPSIIYNGSMYTMWYQNFIKRPNSIETSIYRAVSSDGINWKNEPEGAVIKPESGWGASGVNNPVVIFSNNIYRMWLTSAETGHWSIGYAESNDGINWILNPNNPVITANQPWEGIDADGPSVIQNGSNFELFFHGGGDISYAYSIDGHNWIKPPEMNPVITRSGFDWDGMTSPNVLMLSNGTRALWYSGRNSNSSPYWQIGLATDGPWPTATPIPTESPTPTPTSTPTPTPTPIPTPTIPPVTKAVIIPGLGASMNSEAIQSCSDTNPDAWQSWYPTDQTYKTLKNTLTKYGYKVAFFYFDWRKSPQTIALELRQFLNSNLMKNEKVHVVAHSMGGLVARSYIETEKEKNRISTLVTVGTPHEGTVLAYPAWSAGNIWGDLTWRLAGTLTLHYCRLAHPEMNARQIIQTYFPATQTLLPTFNYLRKLPSLSFIDVNTMNARNSLLPTPFAAPFYGTNVITFSGTGHKTLDKLDVRNPFYLDNKSGNWLDGRPFTRRYTSKGDGTILISSSSLEDAPSYVLNGDHAEIISSRTAVKEIVEKVNNSTVNVQFADSTKLHTILILTTDTATVDTNLPADYVWKNKDTLIFFNPKKGKYQTKVGTKKTNTRIHATVLSDTDDETEQIQEITLDTKGTFQTTLDYTSPTLFGALIPK